MNIFFDMDGVLADFSKEPNGLQRFKTEKGFFKKLKPIKNNHKIVNEMIKKGFNVYILSASPNLQADKDKRAWLKKHIPKLQADKIIFVRLGQNKAEAVQNIGQDCLLIDDYTKNLEQWQQQGGQVLKYLNGYNNNNGTYKQLQIKAVEQLPF